MSTLSILLVEPDRGLLLALWNPLLVHERSAIEFIEIMLYT